MLLPGYYAVAKAGSEITASGWCPQKFYCEFNTGSRNLQNALLLVTASLLHCPQAAGAEAAQHTAQLAVLPDGLAGVVRLTMHVSCTCLLLLAVSCRPRRHPRHAGVQCVEP